jgi:hypothetical protein
MADAKDATSGVAETPCDGLRTRGRKSGFDKPSEYFSSLKNTPKLLRKRAFFVRSPEEQMADKEAAAGDMKKVLNWFHVMALGTGALGGTACTWGQQHTTAVVLFLPDFSGVTSAFAVALYPCVSLCPMCQHWRATVLRPACTAMLSVLICVFHGMPAGMIVGAGIFVSTGAAAKNLAG